MFLRFEYLQITDVKKFLIIYYTKYFSDSQTHRIK
jgi:hypothetical protein